MSTDNISIANETSTSTTSDQQSSISLIIKKLNHELEEIRLRALNNLISKLESNVITELDLVQHKQLFIKLFGLFNFAQFNQHEKVLNLLFKLSKHKSAAKNIQEINGLQFLNALNNDLKDTKLKSKIEEIIESLMEALSSKASTLRIDQISKNQPQNSFMTASCSSLTLTYKNTTEDSLTLQPKSFLTNDESSNNLINNSNFHHTMSVSVNSNILPNCHSIPSSFSNRSENRLESISINSNDLTARTRNALKKGVQEFVSNENEHIKLIDNLIPNNNHSNSTFYWLSLTSMDNQFLKTAENSLKSNDPKKIKNYCTFLQTIVFNDFPAEIFLQRSFILKILIDLIIKSSNLTNKDTEDLTKSLISCLHFYCVKLKKRVDYIKDPSTFCYKDFYSNDFENYSKSIYSSFNLKNKHEKLNKQAKKDNPNVSLYSSDISSIDSSSILSARNAANKPNNSKTSKSQSKLSKKDKSDDEVDSQIDENFNQDLQMTIDTVLSEANAENYQTDAKEMKEIIKREDWPVYSFCFKAIDTLIDCLCITNMRNNNTSQSNDKYTHLDSSLLPLIFETINNLILILFQTKNEWFNLNVVEVFNSLFKKIDFNLKYCYKIQNESIDFSNKYFKILNRAVYLYLVITLYKFINLIHSANESNLSIPNELSETIYLILNDICLVDSFKNIACVLTTILSHLDPDLSEINLVSNEICGSIQSACQFLIQCDQLIYAEKLIEMAKNSLNYMDYYGCRMLPSKIIEFSSKIMLNIDRNDLEISEYIADIEYLVTSCMMSKSNEIRIESYSTILRLVNDSLNVLVAAEINSKRYKRINFLLLNKIFYQLITFGLFDKCEQVKNISENIVSQLIQCELLVPENFKLKLAQLIAIYMPFIQCLASQITPLGQYILKMSDDILTPTSANAAKTEIHQDLLLSLPVERLRSSLRYLFSKDKNLRKKGFQQTVGFLTKYNATSDETFANEIEKFNKKNNIAKLDTFNLTEFYLKFSPDKFNEMAVKLKRKNRNFSSDFLPTSNNPAISIFQAENLLNIYNIFSSETADLNLRQNASEQLAVMISTGDPKLHKAFLSLDGVNYCIRYLRQTSLYNSDSMCKRFLFLSSVERETLNRIQSNCISCLCHVFYWNKEIRQSYIFDIEFYRLLFKLLLISFNMQLKPQPDQTVYSNSQEDLAALLFILLYNQVSSLDYYYESINESQKSTNSNKKLVLYFDLSVNLKANLIEPFITSGLTQTNESFVNKNQSELKQQEKQQWQAYELNYKLNSALKKKIEFCTESIHFKEVLDRKFRLYWNIYWHGGSLSKLCNDLLNNPQLVQTRDASPSFSDNLCLTDDDKFQLKYSNPFYLIKQFCDEIIKCATHEDALNLLDLSQILITIIDGNEQFNLGIDSAEDLDAENRLSSFFNRQKSDWHLALNRFASILPSTKSKSDLLLFSNSFQTISKLLYLQSTFYDSHLSLPNSGNKQLMLISPDTALDEINSIESLDKWLFNMTYNPSSSLVLMIKQFLIDYESDELRINAYLLPLCDFIRVYFERLNLLDEKDSIELYLPSIELLKICIEQIQLCETDKFRNLNKLAILINLISSLLRIKFINSSDENILQIKENLASKKLLLQLVKSLIQIINTFNIGRGGLSLSFMGNFITKSAHVSLLKLVKDSIINSDNEQTKLELVKSVICLKDTTNNLNGSSWLIPLLLHREPQIRSISFSLISLLINVPFAQNKLLANQAGIWSIALNVLLNQYECSIVRSQACAFLINLTSSLAQSIQSPTPITANTDLEEYDNTLSLTGLQLLLHEMNFFERIAITLSTFYPYDTYTLNELMQQNKKPKKASANEELSICSPILVNSICQLLYNLNILLQEEAILMINNHGIMNLLINYVKPINLLTKDSKYRIGDQDWKIGEELVDMLYMICRYLNLCCQMDSNCIGTILNFHKTFVFDLIECLNIKNPINKEKMNPFLSVLFDLLITFLSYNDEKSAYEFYLVSISKCWISITQYLLSELLVEKDKTKLVKSKYLADQTNNHFNQLFQNAIQFYSLYLSKLTQMSERSKTIQILVENLASLFDLNQSESADEPNLTLGSQLCQQLIKEFDKYFLVETNQNLKLIISNIMKTLLGLSSSAKLTALNAGLVETLIEHLKYTHSKLNLKSLSSRGPLKENSYVNDLQQTLLIAKYMMSNALEIKETFTKNGLVSIIHSFWCWANQDQNLLKACLSTLCTLTANNKLAVNQVAQSNISAQTANEQQRLMSSVQTNASCISLLNSIIKTLQKSYLNQPKSLIILKYLFALLTNCAQSNECKNIIWKSNLLQDFTLIDFQTMRANAAKFNYRKEILWLNFLVSLSFTPDGQQFFMKVESLLTTVIKLLDTFNNMTALSSNIQMEIQYLSLLILRNLSFNPSNKSKLVSQSEYINVIIQMLRSKNENFELLAISTIDSLLYDYQKAKVILKNFNVLKYLVELNEMHSKSAQCNTRIQSIVDNLIKILNE